MVLCTDQQAIFNIPRALNLPENYPIGDMFHEIVTSHSIKPYEYAVNTINTLTKNNDVYIVTSRGFKNHTYTMDWLKNQGIQCWKKLYYKKDFTKKYSFDIFIEDGERVVEFAAFKPFEDLIYISTADILFAEERIIERINGKQHYTNRTR